MKYRLSVHALGEMRKRAVPQHLIDIVMQNPQQVVPGHGGKKVFQSKLDFGSGRIFLLRVVVAADVDPAIVITVYRTTRIDKYWQ